MNKESIYTFLDGYMRRAAYLGNDDALRDHHNSPSPRKGSEWRMKLPLPPGMSRPVPPPEEPIVSVPSVKKTPEQVVVALSGLLPEELRAGPGLEFLYGFYVAGFWLFPESMNVDYDLMEVLRRAMDYGWRSASSSEPEATSEVVWKEMSSWIGHALDDGWGSGGQEHVHLAYRAGRWWAGVTNA